MQVLSAVVDRFEKGRVVLRFDDGQELILTKRDLPAKIKEGSVVKLEFFRSEDEEKRRQAIGRYLLEEILRTHDNETP